MSEGSETKVKLRREVTVWGSFCWGYADVGADVYAALGLVMAAAQGVTPLAFAIAGIVYIFVGLAYTEMAAAYPVAGGGHYFTLRGLGDFWGLVAGAALMLDYTVDVALFAIASAGYINFFFHDVSEHKGGVLVPSQPTCQFHPPFGVKQVKDGHQDGARRFHRVNSAGDLLWQRLRQPKHPKEHRKKGRQKGNSNEHT